MTFLFKNKVFSILTFSLKIFSRSLIGQHQSSRPRALVMMKLIEDLFYFLDDKLVSIVTLKNNRKKN